MSDKTLIFLASLFILTVGLLIPSESAGVDLGLSLDGDGDYVEVLRQVQDDFTLECWIKTSYIYPDGSDFWMGAGIIDNESVGFIEDFGLSMLGSKVGFGVNNGFTIKSSLDVNKGTWVHVAGVRIRTSGELKLYINGILENELAGGPTGSLESEPTILFGKNHFQDFYFNGEMNEVRLWNIARTQQEIQATMFTTLTGNETGLAGYWNFDDGTADDLSPNGNHGTLIGDAVIIALSTVTVDIEAVPNPTTVGGPLDILLDLSNRGQGFDAKFRLWVLANNNVTTLVNLSPFVSSGLVIDDFNLFSTASVPAGLPQLVGFLAATFDAASGDLLDSDTEFVGIGVTPSATDINALRQTATNFLNSGAINAAPGPPEPELNFNGKVKNPFEQLTNSKGKLTTTWGRIKSQ